MWGWQKPVGAAEGPGKGIRRVLWPKTRSVAGDEVGEARSLQAVGQNLNLTPSAWEAVDEF